MITLGTKTIETFNVDGVEYTDRQAAIEAVLKKALGGYLYGNRESITIANLARAATEDAVIATLRSLLRALGK